jgi:1,2-phenylacetyl-CoA epoxidase catalytic subunit
MTDTKTGFKTVEDLPDGVADHLASLILSLADTKRLLGIRYSDWILGAPSVEAGIACSAMAQDEWEHERGADGYASCELVDADVSSWPELIALNLLLDTALSVQVELMLDSRFEPIHYKVRKLLDEERFHFDHARGWTARLSSTEAGRASLSEAFEAAWDAVLRVFGPADDPMAAALAEAGVTSGGSDAARRLWLERIAPVVEGLGLGGKTDAGYEPDWADWSAERRRAASGGPDEDTLARARGDRNRALMAD